MARPLPIEIAVPVSPSIHGAHIYAPTFQDDQLNGNGREISHQKQTFSHVSRSAGLAQGDRVRVQRGIAQLQTTPEDFRYEGEGNRADDRAIAWSRASRLRFNELRAYKIRPRRGEFTRLRYVGCDVRLLLLDLIMILRDKSRDAREICMSYHYIILNTERDSFQ